MFTSSLACSSTGGDTDFMHAAAEVNRILRVEVGYGYGRGCSSAETKIVNSLRSRASCYLRL